MDAMPVPARAADRAAGSFRAIVRIAEAILAILVTARERARQRRALAALDDRLLADIGLTKEDAGREIEKPLWRG